MTLSAVSSKISDARRSSLLERLALLLTSLTTLGGTAMLLELEREVESVVSASSWIVSKGAGPSPLLENLRWAALKQAIGIT